MKCPRGAPTVATTVTRRDARRSVVSTAGPRKTSATEFVIARPVSKLLVEAVPDAGRV